MKRSPRIGFRREVLILVPASLLVLIVLAVFTLLSYRQAVDVIAEEARAVAGGAARRVAELVAREARTPTSIPEADRLRSLAPGALAVSLLDADGQILVKAGDLTAEDGLVPLGAAAGDRVVVVGPGGMIGDRIIALAPLGPPQERRYLRLDWPARALYRQSSNLRILTVLVIGLSLGVGLLALLFARRLVEPVELLLERARAANPAAEDADEIPFLLDTFDRALAALSADADTGEGALQVLGRTLTPSLQCGLLLLGPDGRILALNSLGSSLLGIDEPRPGTRYEEALRDHPQIARLLRHTLTGEEVGTRTEISIERDGRTRSLGLTVHELRPEGQDVRGHLVLFADLTDVQRRAERQRLSESLARMGELTAGIAHEMRNSLTSLCGYLARAERQAEGRSVGEELREIRHEADHLKRILDDFLSFARPGTVRMAPVSLERVLRRAASDLALEGKGVRIRSDPSLRTEAIPRVWGDAQLLERALRNLLHNAAQAEEEAGRPEAELVAQLEYGSDGEAVVTIEDQGTGLRPEIRDRLFVPFVSHKEEGVGLGLALAQRILELHGAVVDLENRHSGGVQTRVRFSASSRVTGGGDDPEAGQPPSC